MNDHFSTFGPGWILGQVPAGQPDPAAPAAPADPGTGETGAPVLPPGQRPPQQAGLFEMLMPMIFMFVIFYFLLIRPQQKKQKEHERLINSVKTGDKVVTSAGIHGMVANVKDRTVILKIADNVKIELDRAAIATITRGTEDAA